MNKSFILILRGAEKISGGPAEISGGACGGKNGVSEKRKRI